jgi:hypothetical protein
MAQVKAPPPGFVSAIPDGTAVRGVFMGGHGELYVDLSPEVLKHPGGRSTKRSPCMPSSRR